MSDFNGISDDIVRIEVEEVPVKTIKRQLTEILEGAESLENSISNGHKAWRKLRKSLSNLNTCLYYLINEWIYVLIEPRSLTIFNSRVMFLHYFPMELKIAFYTIILN